MVKVYDTISKIERVITKKAYDIINRGNKTRYKFLEMVDENGQTTTEQLPVAQFEKKTSSQPENAAPPAADVSVNTQVTKITIEELPTSEPVQTPAPEEPVAAKTPKKRGPKPKIKA